MSESMTLPLNNNAKNGFTFDIQNSGIKKRRKDTCSSNMNIGSC